VIAHSRNTPYSIHSCVFKPLRTEAVDRKHGISEPSHADVHPIRGGTHSRMIYDWRMLYHVDLNMLRLSGTPDSGSALIITGILECRGRIAYGPTRCRTYTSLINLLRKDPVVEVRFIYTRVTCIVDGDVGISLWRQKLRAEKCFLSQLLQLAFPIS
jgi:hypothetical protein